MTISETQLSGWSNQGATASSASTYASVQHALEQHSFPAGMQYKVYLQGSYPNATNIRGNSDVDVVVELTSSFYTDVPQEEWSQRGIGYGTHGYADLRQEVLAALQKHYGTSAVDTTGANAISIAASGSRLKADVLPCVAYREYNGRTTYAEGIKFWNQHTGQEKVNFPKIHINNGQAKNQNGTSQRYKPSVRMMKNARERIISSNDALRKKYPSYFVECLIFNVPDKYFVASLQDTYRNITGFLQPALNDTRAQAFTTQSQQRYLFGTDSTQWALTNAQAFVKDLITLWNNS